MHVGSSGVHIILEGGERFVKITHHLLGGGVEAPTPGQPHIVLRVDQGRVLMVGIRAAGTQH